MKVYWRCCRQAEVPADRDWLHPSEQMVLGSLRFEKRRQEWLLGRWTAKRALLALPAAFRAGPLSSSALQPSQIEIRAAGDGAPEVLIRDRRAALALSISHRDELAMCAVALKGRRLGCDLERIEDRSRAFVTDYFTDAERLSINAGSSRVRALWANTIWSAKESALKALRTGLRRDTRSVAVDLARGPGEDWRKFQVADLEGQTTLHGWMRIRSPHVLTIVSDHLFEKPLRLTL